VFSGDTRASKSMISFAKNADVLIHEATFTSELKDVAIHYGHATAKQAADIAKKAGVDRLYLSHISPRYLDYLEILKDAQQVFPDSFVPKDFDEITVPLKK